MKRPGAATIMCLLMATGCAPSLRGPNVLTGSDAYSLVPATDPQNAVATDYVIGAQDSINVEVLYEPDISRNDVAAGADGTVALPLIGQVRAAGLTAAQLSEVLRERYLRYYVDPRVMVSIAQSASHNVNVQGAVQKPGIYPLRGTTTLLDAIALASGEGYTASLSQVVVLRAIEGERHAALFDLNRIRRGEDPDPALQAGDVVVVGSSSIKELRRDILRATPMLNIFTLF
ncbi:polysaccharide biosynthesis/export family protein [Novosphingobium sp. M1R2S20]|uniref:Polysaccharide biosynthesis/export family protein n=1 Tax=Novosphingobium rhizovicinum TaxID=3228928 RepID=A0ABV3R8P3_9SPHN